MLYRMRSKTVKAFPMQITAKIPRKPPQLHDSKASKKFFNLPMDFH